MKYLSREYGVLARLAWSALLAIPLSMVFVLTVSAAALAPTSTVYLDTDNDGQVDIVRISFTDVTACAYEAGDWAVGVAGTINIATVDGIDNTGTCGDDEYIDVQVTADADVTGGGTNPRLDYTDAGTGGSVVADTNEDAANFTATDGARPILLSAALGTATNLNTLTLTYSEPMYIDNTNQDGTIDAGDTTSSESLTSTSSVGGIDAAGSVENVGNAGTAGNYTQFTDTGNTLSLNAGGDVLTITFNNASGVHFFTAGTTAPSGAFTPDNAAYVLAQAPAGAPATTQRYNTSATAPTLSGSWDTTKPSTVSNVEVAAGSTTTQKIISWNASSGADFGQYLLAVDTSGSPDTSDTLWSKSNDANLDAVATTSTEATLGAEDTEYYGVVYAIDIAGNLSTASSIVTFDTNGSSSGGTGDSVAPAAPTQITASVTSDLKVKIDWTDATASDLSYVEIIRSVGSGSTVYSVIGKVNKGIETYTDSNVTAGKVVNYSLRSVDNTGNRGTLSSLMTLTVEEGESAEESDDTVDEDDVEDTEDNSDDSEDDTEGEDDSSSMTYDEEKEMVQDEGIVTKEIDKSTNKCELLVMLGRVLEWDIDESVEEDGFNDTPDWCKPYAKHARDMGIVDADSELGMGDTTRFEFATILFRVLMAEMTEEDPVPVSSTNGGDSVLSLDDSVYEVGEEITLTFTLDEADVTDSAWIGLISSEVEHGSEQVNDENDVDYEYVGEELTGTITFTAPMTAGNWDFRLNSSDTDENSEEVASVTFEVEDNTIAHGYDDEVAEWAEEAVGYLKVMGIMTGYDDDTFRGSNGILKIEAAVALWRALN